MTILLFSILVLLETGFMIFGLTRTTTVKKWTSKRLIVIAGELILFFIMAALPGIDTSFRFIGLIAVLLVRLAAAVIFMLANHKNTKTKKKAAIVLGTLLSISLIGTSILPAFLFTDYEGRVLTGPYNVLQSNAIMIDTGRIEEFENDGSYREVPVYFFYPEGTDDKIPLVIFSHGAFGYYQSNASMYMELASHGYVVASIEHPYHSIFTHDSTGKTIVADRKFLNDSMTIGSSDVSEAEVFEITSEWMKLRLADMNFAIDSIKEGNINNWYIDKDQKEEITKVINLIDTAKIGLIGHSMGGAAAVTCGRRDDISAVVDLDGTMLGENIGINGDEILINEEPYHTPLLNLQNQKHHYQAAEAERSGEVFSNNVIIKNADTAYCTYFINSGHMDFTDLPLFSPVLAGNLGTGSVDNGEMIDTLNALVLDFLDCYLKGEGSFAVNEYY
ncbi:MAG: hypothetical protein IKG30_05315 [Clostridiales bacterium]|nr:hypothetical protein [Clostridiales bacterium]